MRVYKVYCNWENPLQPRLGWMEVSKKAKTYIRIPTEGEHKQAFGFATRVSIEEADETPAEARIRWRDSLAERIGAAQAEVRRLEALLAAGIEE